MIHKEDLGRPVCIDIIFFINPYINHGLRIHSAYISNSISYLDAFIKMQNPLITVIVLTVSNETNSVGLLILLKL